MGSTEPPELRIAVYDTGQFFFLKYDRMDIDIFILNSESLYLVIKILFTLLFPMSS